jgi:hypothetical protein
MLAHAGIGSIYFNVVNILGEDRRGELRKRLLLIGSPGLHVVRKASYRFVKEQLVHVVRTGMDLTRFQIKEFAFISIFLFFVPHFIVGSLEISKTLIHSHLSSPSAGFVLLNL